MENKKMKIKTQETMFRGQRKITLCSTDKLYEAIIEKRNNV